MIEVSGLSKTFKIPVTKEGRFQGLRSLFSREYREKKAVQDIRFRVNKGEFIGYLGPNGAGKSTTIKMLTGILHPTSGTVRIGGLSPHTHRKQVVRNLGVVFGQRTQLWWDLPLKDSYDILAAMYGVNPEQKQRKLQEMDALLGLSEFLQTPVRKLSLGQRMRADLAAAMLHEPDLLFLDEPTIGLDVVAKKNIRGFLKTINEEFGVTILLTTHDMDDIEQLCRRVIVINHGVLAYDGTISQLRKRIGLPTVITVTYVHPPKASSCLTSSSFSILEHSEKQLKITCNRQEITAMEVLRAASQWGEVEDVHMQEPDFEEVIHKIY